MENRQGACAKQDMANKREDPPANLQAFARRIFAVINPVSGSCQRELVRQTLEGHCAAAGMDCHVYETTGKEFLSTIIHQARRQGYTLFVAAGGDGTVSAVASGLVQSGIPLGILPVGTANLVARELGIPLDLEQACRLLLGEHRTKKIDAMQVGDRAFISHISLGTYSRIAEKTSAAAKRYFRRIAYIWKALPELIGRHSYPFELTIDGRLHRVRAAFIMIANVGAMGASALRWGPDIQPGDGRLDICIIRARTITHYVSFIWHVLWGRHKQFPLVAYLSAHTYIRVSTKRHLPVRGDGEIIGRSKVEIRILPGAIQIIVPR